MPMPITVLRVDTPEQMEQLTKDLVVVCTYEALDGGTVNAIDISYLGSYPELQTVDVFESISPL